jgi:hypothetical protein
MEKITTEQLIAYYYHETSVETTSLIEMALANDWNVKEEYEQLAKSIQGLQGIEYSPSEATISKILEYSSGQV